MKSIPNDVLEKIASHRPHLRPLVTNLKNAKNKQMVQALEKALAGAYLHGETKLSPLETWYLSYCYAGEPYAGGRRE